MDDGNNLCNKERTHEEPSKDEDDVDIYQDLDNNEDEGRNVSIREPFEPWEDLTVTEHANKTDIGNVIEDDVDIYGDLKSFEEHLAVEELEAKLEHLEEKCASLDKSNEDMKAELEKVKKINLQLKRNISSIFKTARAELERKDKQLKELQSRYDSLVFRRSGVAKSTQPAESLCDPSMPNHIRNNPKYSNLIELNDQTECVVKMGSVTIGFASDHFDFQKTRLERLKAAIEREKTEENHRGNENIPAKVQDSTRTSALCSTIEDGEVTEGEKPPICPPKRTESVPRQSNRTRSRSRSPPAKRRRSPPGRQRTRSSTRDRETYDRTRRSRSPPRSACSRYSTRERIRSDRRSHAR